MKGDFTRNTFRKHKHFNRVLQQQGRVQLDADWNEQGDIEAHLRETAVRDVVGPSGAPIDGGGFRIESTTGGSGLVIFPGRIWVDGILCELAPGPVVPFSWALAPLGSGSGSGQQPTDGGSASAEPAGAVSAVERRQSPPPRTFAVNLSVADYRRLDVTPGDSVKLLFLGSLTRDTELGPYRVLSIASPQSGGIDLTLGGLAAEGQGSPWLRRETTSYLRQPDFPGAAYPSGDGAYLAYLDVWSRHLTWLDDPQIRETALGGPDTATRAKTVCQVRLLPIGTVGETDLSGNPLSCLSKPDLWSSLTAPPSGRMRARAVPETAPSDPCIVPAGAGFIGLENQLYRVEIHEGSNPADLTFIPTFKWSRDNGSIVTRWVDALTSGQVRVADPGRDSVLGFHQNDWVELIEDGAEADGRQAGELVKIDSIIDDLLTFTPATAKITAWIQAFQNVHQSQSAPPPPAIKMRRWDMLPASSGARPVKAGTGDPADGFLPLENGVQVRFEEGTYKAGDYWLLPARTFIGALAPGIEWPQGDPGGPLALPPQGIEHDYCKLAVVVRSGGVWSVRGDCRNLFPPLTELIELFYVSGDGQEVAPDFGDLTKTVPLPQPLVVGVSNGGLPVQGAKVRFTVTLGNGILPGGGKTFDSPGTDAQGLASCAWQLDSTTLSQQVLAELLDAAGKRRHLPVLFTASLSQASCCCTVEIGDGVSSHGDFDDLQEALTQLAKRVPAEIPIVLCLLRGTHRPPKTVVVSRDRVTIRGCGRATHVVAPAGRPAFQLAAKLGALEGIYLTVEDDAGAPAILCNGSWNRVEGNEVVSRLGSAIWSINAFNLTVAGNRLSGAVPTTSTTTTTTSTTTTSTDSATARAAAAPGGADVSAIVVLKSRLDVTALVILDGGTRFARVTGNLIGPGACHGIGLTLSTLWDVVIASNEISGLGGSGIATINVPPVVIPGDPPSQHFDEAAVASAFLADRQLLRSVGSDTMVIFVPTPQRFGHLRIERNTISGNALGTGVLAGSPPLGGIVLSRLLHVEITGNRIESNGRGQTREPVAGIFIDDCKGLIVRDNVVVDNGPEPDGQTLSGPQGGILATTLTVVVDSVNLGTNTAPINQPDGWPTAAIQDNLVVAPRGRALVLTGMGPMQVTGNRFTARDLLAVVPGVALQLENFVGAVLIHNLGMAGYLYPQIAAGGLRTQNTLAPANGTPATGGDWTVGGKVEFSDNQVSFDFTRGANQTAFAAVGIFTLDDLGLHDNQTECRLLADTLIADTLVVASTVRANGNGFTESMQGVSFSLWSNGLAMSTAVGNQGTHCIVIHGPVGRVRDDDNLAWFCRKDAGQVSFNQAQTDTQTVNL